MATPGKDKSSEAEKTRAAKIEDPAGALATQLDLIALSHEPVFAWDWDLGIVDWNAGAERQYGFTRAEALGKNSHELLASKYPVSLRRFLKKLAADGYWAGEVRHATKDGTELIIDSRQQIIGKNGRRIVVESNRDISERRAAEGQIAILIIIGDLIRTISDPNDLLYETAKTVGVYFNARRCVFSEIDLERDVEIIYRDYHRSGRSVAGRRKLSSYSPITFGDMKAGRVVRNADSKIDPRTADLYKKVYERTGERSYVAVPLMRDRQWKASVWISDDQPHEWTEAEVALLEVIAERVWLAVEKHRNDEALQKSLEFDEAVMHNMSEGLYTVDAEGRVTMLNRAAEKLLGWTLEELRGRSMHDMTHHHYRDGRPFPTAKCARTEVLHTGSPVVDHEDVFIRKDGTFFDVIYSSSPLRTKGGDIIGLVVVFKDITDWKKTIQELRLSEERRQLAQDAANIGIFDVDLVAGKTYWSETMWAFYGETHTGVDPDEQYWLARLHDLDRERVALHLRDVLEKGEDFRDEYRITRTDGGLRWMEARAKVVRDGSGKAVRMYGVNIDITPRKEAEEKIRLSDNQLRMVTDSVPALISYVDKNERYGLANETYADWFGIPKGDVVGKRPRDIFGDGAYQVLKPWIRKALSGEKCSFETVLSYNGIDEKHVSVSYIPDIDADGTVNGYFGLTYDRTDQKHSEDLLRSSQERIGLITDSFTDYAIFSMDKNGIIESWNNGAETIFGYSRDEVVGRSYEFVFTPDDLRRGVWTKEMRNSRLKGRSFYEGWRLKKDGSRFFASAVMMPLYVGDTLTGYSKIVSDLTKKQRQAEELQKAHDELEVRVEERTKELAESNAALVEEMSEREIAEKQRVELLSRLVSSQEFERRRFARDLHDQMGQRLTALRLKLASLHELMPEDKKITTRINRLEAIAEQLDSEVSFLAWELRPAALDDLGVLEAIRTFVNEWSRHFEISADFHPSGLPNERLEREVETHLYRITQEALNNIAKHADAKHVTVLLEKREQNIMLIIEDDGNGFDLKEDRALGEYGGGLGLTGMSERAALIGGTIEIESAPGRGTTIYVRLPDSKRI